MAHIVKPDQPAEYCLLGKPHAFQVFDATRLFCTKCGATLTVDPPAQPIYSLPYVLPCTLPHYPCTRPHYPAYPWWSTTTGTVTVPNISITGTSSSST